MKKTIGISITGVESAKMQKLQKANAAIRTLREFAQEMKRETETSVLGVSAVAEPGNEPEAGEAFLYFFQEVDADKMNEILNRMKITLSEFETDLKDLSACILTGITKEKPQA